MGKHLLSHNIILLCMHGVQWSAIFPTEQVTEQQSALFVKKLLAVAVSMINLYIDGGLGTR